MSNTNCNVIVTQYKKILSLERQLEEERDNLQWLIIYGKRKLRAMGWTDHDISIAITNKFKYYMSKSDIQNTLEMERWI